MKLETATRLFVLLLASETTYTDIGTIGIYIYTHKSRNMYGWCGFVHSHMAHEANCIKTKTLEHGDVVWIDTWCFAHVWNSHVGSRLLL